MYKKPKNQSGALLLSGVRRLRTLSVSGGASAAVGELRLCGLGVYTSADEKRTGREREMVRILEVDKVLACLFWFGFLWLIENLAADPGIYLTGMIYCPSRLLAPCY